MKYVGPPLCFRSGEPLWRMMEVRITDRFGWFIHIPRQHYLIQYTCLNHSQKEMLTESFYLWPNIEIISLCNYTTAMSATSAFQLCFISVLSSSYPNSLQIGLLIQFCLQRLCTIRFHSRKCAHRIPYYSNKNLLKTITPLQWKKKL